MLDSKCENLNIEGTLSKLLAGDLVLFIPVSLLEKKRFGFVWAMLLPVFSLCLLVNNE